MKVLAVVHMYPPRHNAGAELMLHTMLRYLTPRHELRVLTSRNQQSYVHEGVSVSGANNNEVARWMRWADVAVTHLDHTRAAMAQAQRARKPLVHIVHNDRQLTFHRVRTLNAQLVVFNSRWISDAAKWAGPSIIIRPPVVARDYKTTPGQALTLINLTLSKGAEVFYELARLSPGSTFLGVRGSYGQQVIPRVIPPNVEIIDNTPSMKQVYGRTRILLMPSDYESWGRVGIEAAASGIPTIAHPTPGLLEALGDAGIFCDRSNPSEWLREIKRLERPRAYTRASRLSLVRSKQLDPTEELDLFERSLLGLVK